MSATLLMIIAIFSLLIGYVLYGRLIAQKLGLDPKRATPAHTKQDGLDYVPTRAPAARKGLDTKTQKQK